MLSKIIHLNWFIINKMMAKEQLNEIDTWTILRKLGGGSFGQIFQAIQKGRDSGSTEHYAIKTQSITNVKQMLLLEYRIYQEFVGEAGFPRVLSYSEKQHFSYLVMEKFDTTLDKYATKLYPKSFVPKDCLLTIMNSSLHILQRIHEKGLLYRDMKPSNFMLKAPFDELFIIDFGLSKNYIINEKHICEKVGKKLVGTPVFCSLNTHKGIQQSRRDDIECWVYTMLFLAMPLPWEQIVSKNYLSKQQQYNEIGKIKQSMNWQRVAKNYESVPSSLISILQLAKKLKFEEQPEFQKYFQSIDQEYRKLSGKNLPSNYAIEWKSSLKDNKEVGKKKVNRIKFVVKVKVGEKKDFMKKQKQNIDAQCETLVEIQ